MRPALERIAPPAIVLALALARIVAGDPFAERAPREPPEARPEPEVVSESARAVLDGLEAGDAVGALEVVRIAGPTQGEITVELRGAECGIRAWVARRGSRQHEPPVRTERFDLVYGPPPPGTEACPGEVAEAVLAALGARIEAGGAERPSDM